MAGIKYQRLTRNRRGQGISLSQVRTPGVSLWLGDDHLLLVEQLTFQDNYRRFPFRDIQAITLRRTPARLIWNWVLGVPMAVLLVGVGFFFATGNPIGVGSTFVCGGILVLALVLLIYNLRGASCTCEIKTAVQTRPVSSLSRIPQADKVLARLRPLIQAAQAADAAPAAPAAPVAPAAPAAPASPEPSPGVTPAAGS